jgi:integrase
MGSIYRRGGVLWIKYYRNGIPMRESAETDKESVAKNLLKQREGDIVRGVPITPKTNRVTLDELATDVVNDYKTNGKRSLRDIERHFETHLKPVFSGWRMVNITTVEVRKYIAARQEEEASNATINRELCALKRAFSLGMQAGKLTYKPHIPMLREANVRTGFFEPERFEAVRVHLPAPLQPLVHFAYITGWRVPSEVQPLQWRQVDFATSTVRLDAGTTKNGDGRVFPMTQELRALLQAQREHTDTVQRERGIICPWVFHRNGEPIRVFRKAWATACQAAGCPGMIRHDFRRTAVRNLVRRGIVESVAMKMTGHKTRSVFERYNIVSEGDLTDAAAKLDAAKNLTGTITGTIPASEAPKGSHRTRN